MACDRDECSFSLVLAATRSFSPSRKICKASLAVVIFR